MLYIADTNVISELVKKEPSPNVLGWCENHEGELALTVVTIEEMHFGALMLPEGKRRTKLLETIAQIIDVYESRTFSFDARAALECARLHRKAIAAGRTPTIEDLMIAAICICQDATLATRNVRDFDYLGIRLVNPFEG